MYKVDPYRKFAKRDKNENRLLTRKQKKKIMSLPLLRDTNKNPIPKSREKRRELITKKVRPHVYFCPAIKANIEVTDKNISHYRSQAPGSVNSMKALMNIRTVINRGRWITNDPPKKNKSQRAYKSTNLLFCRIKGIGVVKLVIGNHKVIKGRREAYSISAISIE